MLTKLHRRPWVSFGRLTKLAKSVKTVVTAVSLTVLTGLTQTRTNQQSFDTFGHGWTKLTRDRNARNGKTMPGGDNLLNKRSLVNHSWPSLGRGVSVYPASPCHHWRWWYPGGVSPGYLRTVVGWYRGTDGTHHPTVYPPLCPVAAPTRLCRSGVASAGVSPLFGSGH